MNGLVCLSIRLSVCPSVSLSIMPFSQCSCYHIIIKLSGDITISKCEAHAESQGQRSKVKITMVKIKLPQLVCFRTIIPVQIHMWLWNNAQSFKWYIRGALLFLRSSSKFNGNMSKKNWWFLPHWPKLNSCLNSQIATKCCAKLEIAQKRCTIVFQGYLSNFKVTRAEKSIIWLWFEHSWMTTPVLIHGWLWNETHSF